MKKVFNWMLMAAVVLGLGVSVTSCSDDDDDNNNGNEQKKDDVNKLDTDEARVAFRWLCVLADVTTLDENWQSKTYEPTVGVKSDNNEFTRLIIVNNLDEAKVNFAKLADMETEQLATAQTINGGAAGTMKWTPSKEGAQNLAEVEVSSRIMPHLQKIVYCTEEQTGQNGLLWDSMKGVAYYRLGDVVRDAEGYYWICVRPSFAPDKGDSHWINIYNAGESGKVNGEKKPIKSENVCEDYNKKDKYKGVTIKLPTQLSYDREHIYNLNNLIWALLNPTAYRDACLEAGNAGKGLGGFEYDYHGETFLNLVAGFWEEKAPGSNYSIWETLFGMTHEKMKNLTRISFHYQGYKWWWGTTADMWLYTSTKYEKKISGSESGDKASIEVVANGFDINRYAGDPTADKNSDRPQFVSDYGTPKEGTWVVRYKRGDKLSTTKYDPYNRLGGCEDVYRFNKNMDAPVGKTAAQQTDSSLKNSGAQPKARVGYVVGYDGKFYITSDGAEKAGTRAAALVVYYNANQAVEKGTEYHGLAFALTDCGDGRTYAWAEGAALEKTGCTQTPVNPNTEGGELADVLDGIAMTSRLGHHYCDNGHKHPAAETVVNMASPVDPNSTRKADFSNWFIPSAGQVILAAKSVGYTWTGDIATGGVNLTGNGNWPWKEAGLEVGEFNTIYCTSTESSVSQSFYTFSALRIMTSPFRMGQKIRPMVAFK